MASQHSVVTPTPGRQQTEQYTENEMYYLVSESFRIISERQCLRNRWLTDSGLLSIILDRYSFHGLMRVDKKVLNTAISKKYLSIDQTGKDRSTSLQAILADCPDFAEEMSALEHLGKQLGVNIVPTPKYHAEMAGEGVEYGWAMSKNAFKWMSLKDRKTKEKFRKAVDKVLSSETVSIYHARATARRARSYIRAYHYLASQQSDLSAVPESFVDIERVSKLLRSHSTHRSASDTDTAFCNSLFSIATSNT